MDRNYWTQGSTYMKGTRSRMFLAFALLLMAGLIGFFAWQWYQTTMELHQLQEQVQEQNQVKELK